MVKLRSARYCNLKLFLIYLVVYGHWIEPCIWENGVLLLQYRWIYAVHMPLFAFLSGLFLKNERDCAGQLRRMLPLYILLQAVAVVLGDGGVKPLTPWWVLWYLLSLCFWMGAAWLWFHFGRQKLGWLILAAAVGLGCAAGYVPQIHRGLSLSRTLVFFPYFWAGLLCRADRRFSKTAGGLGLGLAVWLMNAFGSRIPTYFFYQAAPYGSIENGGVLRLICYGIGGGLCLFLLAMAPDKRFPFTRAGSDTMPVYLLHAPLVLVLREWKVPWAVYPVLAGVLIFVIYKLGQWRSPVYGIVSEKRRRGGGIISKRLRRIRETGVPLPSAADR